MTLNLLRNGRLTLDLQVTRKLQEYRSQPNKDLCFPQVFLFANAGKTLLAICVHS